MESSNSAYAQLETAIVNISDFIWGGVWDGNQIVPFGPIAVLLLGAGLYLMIRLGGRPLRRFVPALVEVWKGRKGDGDPSTITPFQALSTALSGQVGTGNIVGVAVAISVGGPGAIFWMWITAIFGMALAFAESSLAIKYRELDEYGRINGGPMYYIKNGLGKGWGWLAVLFCIGTLISASATGGMVQANGIAQNIAQTIEPMGVSLPAISLAGMNIDLTVVVIGAVLSALVFIIIVGGIKSIGGVAERLVPIMAAVYIVACLAVLIVDYKEIPHAFGMIFASALGLDSAVGGVTGYAIIAAMRFGVARGLFSNEAGQGSAPIAHAASQMRNPSVQGEIAMIGVFIDTLVLCTMTALVILTAEGLWPTVETARAMVGETTTHIWLAEGANPATLTNQAFADALPGPIGGWMVTVCLALFAFTTIIGWSYYGEQALTYLVGEWATKPFRIAWVLVIFIGAIAKVDFVWLFGDIANATMVLPNLIAVLMLSGVVIAIHKRNGDPETEDGNSVIPHEHGVAALHVGEHDPQ
ncbi:MAG: sodium:alanine symporter family protein [Hyphomonas sp.]